MIVLVVLLLFIFFSTILDRTPGALTDYGVFLGKGLVDTWEYRGGRASLSIEDNQEEISDYSVYITDQTMILKEINLTNKGGRILQPGNLNEINEGVFVEIYLQNPYQDITRTAKTIIYWE